jgi:hypothetical protein
MLDFITCKTVLVQWNETRTQIKKIIGWKILYKHRSKLLIKLPFPTRRDLHETLHTQPVILATNVAYCWSAMDRHVGSNPTADYLIEVFLVSLSFTRLLRCRRTNSKPTSRKKLCNEDFFMFGKSGSLLIASNSLLRAGGSLYKKRIRALYDVFPTLQNHHIGLLGLILFALFFHSSLDL